MRFLLVFLLLAGTANAADVVRLSAVYADSRWDISSDVDSCDLCESKYWPRWIRVINNYARASAYASQEAAACDSVSDPDLDPTGAECPHLLDRAVYRDTGPLNGSCAMQPSSWYGSTCIADQPVHSSNEVPELLVLDYGANDTRINTDADTSGWATTISNFEDNYRTVLTLNQARVNPFRCVLSIPAPIYADNNVTADPTYEVINSRITNDIRGVVETLAGEFGCEVMDLFTAVDSLSTDEEKGAQYESCDPPFGQTQDGGDVDCVHYSLNASAVIGEMARAFYAIGQRTVNKPVDTDGDGNLDFVFVDGDYDGDGNVDTDDIQAAVLDLEETVQKSIQIGNHQYSPSESGDLGAQVSLHSKTQMSCDSGATILGPDDTTIATYTTNRLIANSAVISPTDRTTTGDYEVDEQMGLSGCSAQYQFADGYNATGWTTDNHFGLYWDFVEDFQIDNNTIQNTHHTCFYVRSGQDGEISNNTAGDGCGGANESTPHNQSGIYLFASRGRGGSNVRVYGNTIVESGGPALETRTEWTCSEDGTTTCTTDGDCSGTCDKPEIVNAKFQGNTVQSAGGSAFIVYSARDIEIDSNVIQAADTDGIFVSDGATEVNGVDGATITNNTISTTRTPIVISGYSADVVARNNTVSSADNVCLRARGPESRNIIFDNNDGGPCTRVGNDNIQGVWLDGTGTISGIQIINNDLDDLGDSDFADFLEVDVDVTGLVVRNNSSGSASNSGEEAINLDTVPGAGELTVEDNDFGSKTTTITVGDAAEAALSGTSRITTDSAPDGPACSPGAQWTDSTTDTTYTCNNAGTGWNGG